MLKPDEKNAFLYETKKLKPFERKEMVIDFIAKAKALCEQELVIDEMHSQMDVKTMGTLEKGRYEKSIQGLDDLIKILS